MIKVGDVVTYVDPRGEEHDALLTAVHGTTQVITTDTGETRTILPCVNLVYVLKDDARRDNWGRQIERESSVACRDAWGTAHGNHWKPKTT